MVVFVPHQGSLQNVKLIFNKEIEELMNSIACPSHIAPAVLDDGGQQFSAGKLYMLYFSLTAPKPLAKWTVKKLQVEHLGLLVILFVQDFCAAALTFDDLCSLWSSSNLHASRREFFTV